MTDTKTKRVTVFLPPETNTELRIEAATQGTDLSPIVTEALHLYFAHKDRQRQEKAKRVSA
jgi:hypothetical protein